jgi:hypothetical protein
MKMKIRKYIIQEKRRKKWRNISFAVYSNKKWAKQGVTRLKDGAPKNYKYRVKILTKKKSIYHQRFGGLW